MDGFKVGDVVALKSGGTKMVVSQMGESRGPGGVKFPVVSACG